MRIEKNMLKLKIPFTSKTYKWNAHNNAYDKIVGEYHQKDHGKSFMGRIYSYHPTKGWRSKSTSVMVVYHDS